MSGYDVRLSRGSLERWKSSVRGKEDVWKELNVSSSALSAVSNSCRLLA